VLSWLELQYANANVYKKQHILRFSKENRDGYRPETIKAGASRAFNQIF
jgi:hypothetical protein